MLASLLKWIASNCRTDQRWEAKSVQWQDRILPQVLMFDIETKVSTKTAYYLPTSTPPLIDLLILLVFVSSISIKILFLLSDPPPNYHRSWTLQGEKDRISAGSYTVSKHEKLSFSSDPVWALQNINQFIEANQLKQIWSPSTMSDVIICVPSDEEFMLTIVIICLVHHGCPPGDVEWRENQGVDELGEAEGGQLGQADAGWEVTASKS